jgi:hypothetical protein
LPDFCPFFSMCHHHCEDRSVPTFCQGREGAIIRALVWGKDGGVTWSLFQLLTHGHERTWVFKRVSFLLAHLPHPIPRVCYPSLSLSSLQDFVIISCLLFLPFLLSLCICAFYISLLLLFLFKLR